MLRRRFLEDGPLRRLLREKKEKSEKTESASPSQIQPEKEIPISIQERPLENLFLFFFRDRSTPETHVLEETVDSWLVKTPNFEASPVDTFKPNPDVTVTFGQKNGKMVIKSIDYKKTAYTMERVQEIMKDKLLECKRCNEQKSQI